MPHFDVYRDLTRRYRWRLTSTRGNVLAEAPIGYRNQDDCLAAICFVKQEAPAATVEGVKLEEAAQPR